MSGSVRILSSFALITALFVGCAKPAVSPKGDASLSFPGERHLKEIRQLTAGGTNAEAYWSFDGTRLSFQRKVQGHEDCDQIYTMNADGSELRRVSSGKGRTTCAFFFPSNERILYSSTHASGDACPPNPDYSKGYVWPIYDSYQFYSVKHDGTDVLPLEPGAPRAYNAEATVCQDGTVVFTSDRDGDLDLYTAKLDPMGTIRDVKRITSTVGYDGGAVFSPDCTRIAWRASRPKSEKERKDYLALLKQHLVRPSQLEIWVANVDGSHARQVTRVGAASFAPGFTPDGKSLLFASNPRDRQGRRFDIYKIGTDGTRLEQVTFSDSFDSFPMFSPDGKHLAFSSNRNGKSPRETNVFVADWIEGAPLSISVDDADAANRFMSAVQALSAPEMEGRGVGTKGLVQAEEWVASRFRALGLKPFLPEGYFQEVEFKAKAGSPSPRARNVVASWGDRCGKTKPVLIGAHLDHLGHGAENSLEPTKKGIHAGADDNASGVAGILEAARILSAEAPSKESCYVFAAFTGEESGIVGSSRLVERLKQMKALPKAMLNLDMVGRLENNRLTVFGTASAKEWPELVGRECASRMLACPGGGDGYGPSDHMAFYIAKVPVLHFFTGPHVDYHRASDLSEKINATGGVQTAEAVAALARAAMSRKQPLHYQRAKETPSMGLVGKLRVSNGAYLGTIPDYSALSSPHGPAGGGMPGGGIRLAGVRPGSPAEKAGLKEGDILTSIDARAIGSLEDFMKILVELKPGQEIVLGVKRGTESLKLPATVGKREK